jgi:hypothetical protein
VQPPDVGYHADFQRELDRAMIPAKKAALAKKARCIPTDQVACVTKPIRLTANEWRELLVEQGGRVWHELISEETVAASHLAAGISNNLDGSQNKLAKAQLPSGKHIFPSYRNAERTPCQPAQTGFGVVVIGGGCEVVSSMDSQTVSAQTLAEPARPQLVLLTEKGDEKLVFRTEKEQQEDSRAAQHSNGKKRKAELPAPQEEESSSESDDEEQHALTKSIS